MKIIISHDIDHLSVKEHIFKDLIIPKYIFWSLSELLKGKISFSIFLKKITGLIKKNSWNNLEELLEFDKKNGVDSTFFVAVNNGKGLSYPTKKAVWAVNLIKKYNFDAGVHGICYDDFSGIKKEYDDFKKISGLDKFGIRMHYLRMDKNTLENLSKAGYLFDSSVLSDNLKQEYNINNMVEFPFHIMESYLLGPQVNFTLEEVKEKTKEFLDKAEREGKKYIAILFHQESFSERFFAPSKEWYLWLINYCKNKNYEFINYKSLI